MLTADYEAGHKFLSDNNVINLHCGWVDKTNNYILIIENPGTSVYSSDKSLLTNL